MARRRNPNHAYIVDTELVRGERASVRHQWLRELMLTEGVLTKDLLLSRARRVGSPFYDLLNKPVNTLVAEAQWARLRAAIRPIVYVPSHGVTTQRFRAWATVVIGGVRRLEPTPSIIRNPVQYNEVINRARSFERAWRTHRINMRRLHSLPRNIRWWKVP